MIKIDSKIPEGPVAEKWTNYKAHQKLVNPANKRRLDIIVVGTGLAGASAAASLGEMGFRVFNFCIQDSPRRAHSIAAQGGINAAKNYQNDGDSVYRLFYDTVKGGDYRARDTKIDWWFLDKMQHLADLEKGLAKCEGVLSEAQYKEAKKYGFQDKTIKRLAKVDKLPVENYRAGFKTWRTMPRPAAWGR